MKLQINMFTIKSYSRYKEDLITTIQDAFEFKQKFVNEFPELDTHHIVAIYDYTRFPVVNQILISKLDGKLYETSFNENEYQIDDDNYGFDSSFIAPKIIDNYKFIFSDYEAEIPNIKIYLDDVRQTPEGFVRTYTVHDTIELIEKYNGYIDTISLDNDLGENMMEGYWAAEWIESKAYFKYIEPIPNLLIHSSNPVNVEKMRWAFKHAKEFWNR